MDKIKKLRVGSLLLAVVQIIALVAIIAVGIVFVTAHPSLASFFSSTAFDIGLAVLIIIGIASAGYFFLLQGFKGVDGAGFAGSVLFFVSLFFLLADIPVIIYAVKQILDSSFSLKLITVAIIPAVASLVLFAISDILIGIGFYHLGERHSSNTLKIGGALLGASIVIDVILPEDISSFFSVFTYLLIYRGLGEIQPKIEVTQAVIKDSQAYIFLNSNVNGIITSARTEKGVAASEITPQIITRGQNAVLLKFPSQPEAITLTVMTENGLIEITAPPA